jgi:hypothetical protein
MTATFRAIRHARRPPMPGIIQIPGQIPGQIRGRGTSSPLVCDARGAAARVDME